MFHFYINFKNNYLESCKNIVLLNSIVKTFCEEIMNYSLVFVSVSLNDSTQDYVTLNDWMSNEL